MAESTGHAWEWGLNSGAQPLKTLGVIDRNYNAGMIKPNANEQVNMRSFQKLYGYNGNNEVENKCYW